MLVISGVPPPGLLEGRDGQCTSRRLRNLQCKLRSPHGLALHGRGTKTRGGVSPFSELVGGLGVVVSPGSEVIISLTGAAVHLDLDSPNLHHHIIIIVIIIIITSSSEGTEGTEGTWSILRELPRYSHERFLLQDKHGVGGGYSSQAKESESVLHVS